MIKTKKAVHQSGRTVEKLSGDVEAIEAERPDKMTVPDHENCR